MYPVLDVQALILRQMYDLREAEALRRAKWDEYWGFTGAPERRGRSRVALLATMASALSALRLAASCLQIGALRFRPANACAQA